MEKTYSIGNLKLKNRVFLAPMHEVNDIAFRMLCKKEGADLTYTGLINPQTKEKLFLDDNPALQFACNSEKGIKEFIKKYDKRISLYDFNLGCPSQHAKSSKLGSFMIKDERTIDKILRTIKQNTKKPITLKIRKMPEKNTKSIIKIAEKYCDAIAVHPRTQEQGYSGEPDIDYAKKVKNMTKLPVIYSGNITNKEQAEKMLEKFDFVMIGRQAIGNPNIFAELTDTVLKKKINFSDWLKLAKKIEGKKLGVNQIKFQALNFTRGFEGSSKMREKISKAKTEKEIIKAIKI